ncbi:hypothetical protein N825_26245 [Skermanella stibiiresistens SB22]|uniref:Uncharacterized protein n=1 Tax=Skermanella stibiiresistens SB22 TaxID=1385369 RepID=W9GRJ4_9PROT|nr:hypothetical protein N825_26245 [Skermanella stibiiresistens SB22]
MRSNGRRSAAGEADERAVWMAITMMMIQPGRVMLLLAPWALPEPL